MVAAKAHQGSNKIDRRAGRPLLEAGKDGGKVVQETTPATVVVSVSRIQLCGDVCLTDWLSEDEDEKFIVRPACREVRRISRVRARRRAGDSPCAFRQAMPPFWAGTRHPEAPLFWFGSLSGVLGPAPALDARLYVACAGCWHNFSQRIWG